MASLLTDLTNPDLVARFQKWCGVELVADDNQNLGRFGAGEPATVIQNSAPSPADDSSVPIPAGASFGHEKCSSNNNNNDLKPHLYNGVSGVKNGYHLPKNGVVNGTTLSAKHFDKENDSIKIRRCSPTWGKETVGFNGDISKHSAANQGAEKADGKTATRVSIRYPVLLYWARVGAFLGNEEFYLTGLPFLLWTVDSAMLRQMIMVWWLVMYLGQAGKDYFAWPRPPSPPVVRLETTHLAEYSMPSTHAMAGTAIPLLLSKLLLERYQLPTVPVLCVAFLWCFTTCLSRLYLGVHTVLDILSGFLVSLILYFLVSPLTPGYDLYQQTHPLAPLVLVLTSLALCTICYPSGPGKTSAKGDAITTTAVVVGLGVGCWLNYQLGYSQVLPTPVRLPISAPTLAWAGKSLLQFVVGVAVVYLVKVVMKRLTVRFFSFFFGLDRPDAQHPAVMVGATYTTYLCLGLVIGFLDPLLFTWLGFGRPGYYMEVL